ALGIDENTSAEFLENTVAVARLCIETHGVGEAGTTTALNSDAESALVRRHTVFGEQRENLFRCAFRNCDFRGCRCSCFCCHKLFPKLLAACVFARCPD